MIAHTSSKNIFLARKCNPKEPFIYYKLGANILFVNITEGTYSTVIISVFLFILNLTIFNVFIMH
jgi:hypothetical protein